MAATYPDGVAGYELFLDGAYLAGYTAAGSPVTYPLPITSLNTSGLNEGVHRLRILALRNDPFGVFKSGLDLLFDVTHPGGGPPPIPTPTSPPNPTPTSPPGGGTPTPTRTPTPCSDTSPPTVSLTAPAQGSTHGVGTPLTISANASDNIGVTKVEFYRGSSTLIGTDFTAPYQINWTPGATGNVTLKAKAYDACNVTTSASRTITVVDPCAGDKAGPTLSITYPPAGPVHSPYELVVSANASDPSGVDRVEFQINPAGESSSDSTAPYEHIWWAPEIGNFTAVAKAFDTCGNFTQKQVAFYVATNEPPQPPPPEPP